MSVGGSEIHGWMGASVVAEWAWMEGGVRVSLCETTRESNTASRDAAVRVCPW